MAELSGFGPGQEGMYKFDPIRQHQWELIISNLNGDEDLIKLVLQTCDRPKVESEEIVAHHFNDRFKLAGKVKYSNIVFTMFDAIPNSETGKYASEILRDWRNEVFDPITNEMKPASVYKRNATLYMYDGMHNLKQEFSLIGCFPRSLDYGKVDYKSSDPVEIVCELSVDKAFLV